MIKKIKGKYVVCYPNGKPRPTNPKGPRGAIGHDTKEDAERQLKAIRIPKYAAIDPVFDLETRDIALIALGAMPLPYKTPQYYAAVENMTTEEKRNFIKSLYLDFDKKVINLLSQRTRLYRVIISIVAKQVVNTGFDLSQYFHQLKKYLPEGVIRKEVNSLITLMPKKAGIAKTDLDKELASIISKAVVATIEELLSKLNIPEEDILEPKYFKKLMARLPFFLKKNTYHAIPVEGLTLYIDRPIIRGNRDADKYVNEFLSELRVDITDVGQKGIYRISFLSSPLISINLYKVLQAAESITTKDFYMGVYSNLLDVIGHELLHAIDEGYTNYSGKSLVVDNSSIERYMNTPTELKSWAHTIAIGIWRNMSDTKKVAFVFNSNMSYNDIVLHIQKNPELHSNFMAVSPENRRSLLKNVYIHLQDQLSKLKNDHGFISAYNHYFAKEVYNFFNSRGIKGIDPHTITFALNYVLKKKGRTNFFSPQQKENLIAYVYTSLLNNQLLNHLS